MRLVKNLTVIIAALCLFVAVNPNALASHSQPPQAEQTQTNYVWAGYTWNWWDGGYFDVHLSKDEQAYILQGGTVALAALAAQACSLLGPAVWACVAAVATAGYFLVKQVEAYNGSCDDLILFVTPSGYVYDSYCWNDIPSGGGSRGFGSVQIGGKR